MQLQFMQALQTAMEIGSGKPSKPPEPNRRERRAKTLGMWRQVHKDNHKRWKAARNRERKSLKESTGENQS